MAFLRLDGILARSLSNERCPDISLSVITTNLYFSLIKPCCKSDLSSVIKLLLSAIPLVWIVSFGSSLEFSNSENRFSVPTAGAVKITLKPDLRQFLISKIAASYLFA